MSGGVAILVESLQATNRPTLLVVFDASRERPGCQMTDHTAAPGRMPCTDTNDHRSKSLSSQRLFSTDNVT